MSDKIETEFNAKDNTPLKGQSIYIKASAGTGKTYNIQKIVRQLLERKEVPQLEKILIVTFTEKAAGELRDRIRKELAGFDADVDNAPIYTIHSFCQQTLEEFAFTANKPASLELIDEEEINDFIDRAIRDGLENDENFRTELIPLFENAENKDSFIESLKKDLKQAVAKYYPDEKIVELDANSDSIYLKYEGKKEQKDYTFEDCDFLLEKEESGNYDEVKKDITRVFTGKDAANHKKNIEKYKKARFYGNILKSLYQAWQLEKSQNKQQSFNDMIRNVREAVCEKNSALKKELQKKYDVAIIDEFQDTNQQQWDIFREVFKNENHSLIVVGDPKQSIYAFQGADVNVYENAIGTFENGYKLSHNYRSTDQMIEACNRLFEQDFFKGSDITFFKSEPPEAPGDKTLNATFDGKEIKPFWICNSEKKEKNEDGSVKKSEVPISAEDFANLAVEKIVDCCTYDKNGKTRLQVYEKKEKNFRNVSFKDFAVLAKTSPEMEEIENAMKDSGIPFLRYKDKNLFRGTECKHWISLINAIASPDFTGHKRAFLSEALFTRFFDIPIENVTDEKYDSPTCDERKALIEWQMLAEDRKWAKLLESIFEKTQIEKRLSGLDNLQTLSKFRQIGEYIVEYLYKNDSSLDGVSRHLSRLVARTESPDDEGSLVARGTDFDCVQLMTIHASKGLEFPVVIAAGGFKQRNNQIPQVYLYHEEKKDDEGKPVEKYAKLSFSEDGKEKMKKEEEIEWQRLFYVAYTRASSLMILPNYEKSRSGDKEINNVFTKTITASLSAFMQNDANKKLYENFIFSEENNRKLSKEVQEILKHKKEKESDGTTEDSQKEVFTELKDAKNRLLKKNSYSSLGHKKIALNEYVSDKYKPEEEDDDENLEETSELSDSDYLKGYPRGSKLGLALHSIFEKIDFETALPIASASSGKRISDYEELCTDSDVKALIEDSFSEQGLKIDEEDSKNWRKNTAQIVWNTLSARLKELTGEKEGEAFSLREILLKDRSSEVEFNFMPEEFSSAPEIRNYFNGFIDLIFVRNVDGKEVYSLLDWKSDTLPDYSESETANHSVEKYSIQMVLYSYCLVKWLKTFPKYSSMDYNEIYKNHFGGIYYVYLRGTKAGTDNGIFAQKWENWKMLNTIFNDKICKKMKTESKK
ncbi:MAG: UvrD-helicase domain-containing protein [Treponema sp.]|nr:UvrD-helicase domain-containing protein [Treponema sp.]